jgi:hypothetical protein
MALQSVCSQVAPLAEPHHDDVLRLSVGHISPESAAMRCPIGPSRASEPSPLEYFLVDCAFWCGPAHSCVSHCLATHRRPRSVHIFRLVMRSKDGVHSLTCCYICNCNCKFTAKMLFCPRAYSLMASWLLMDSHNNHSMC